MSVVPDPAKSFSDDTSKNDTTVEGRDPVTGRFLKGVKGVGGRKRGSRSKLGEAFLNDLYADWLEHGAEAIAQVRFRRPHTYLQVIGRILPQKIEISTPTDGLSDERLAELLEFAERMAATALPGDNAKPVTVIEAQPLATPSFSVAPPTEAAQRAEAKRLDLIDQSEAANAAAPVLPSQALPHPVGRPFPTPDHVVDRRNRAKLTDDGGDIDPASLF